MCLFTILQSMFTQLPSPPTPAVLPRHPILNCFEKELARNRQALYSDRERQRREQQEEAETKECTFRPNIVASSAAGWGAAAEAAAEGTGYDSDEAGGHRRLPLHERLHKEAREREAARALAHHHLEKETLRECTFRVCGDLGTRLMQLLFMSFVNSQVVFV